MGPKFNSEYVCTLVFVLYIKKSGLSKLQLHNCNSSAPVILFLFYLRAVIESQWEHVVEITLYQRRFNATAFSMRHYNNDSTL